MYFDGSVAKDSVGAGVYIISPIRYFKALSYKLNFECTNNVVEYESLLLGLHALKYLIGKNIYTHYYILTKNLTAVLSDFRHFPVACTTL